MSTTVLERELYALPEAARLLRVAPSTLQWWLEGRTLGRKTYAPVLRSEPTGSKVLTWGEFVEARYLRSYRKDLQVPLQQLRIVIERLREQFGVQYPLATLKPFVAGNREVVLKAQDESGLPPDFWLFVGIASGQAIVTPATETFLQRVDFSEDDDQWAMRIHPTGDKTSPVVFDPDYSYGLPTVRGIRTEIIAELAEAGEPVEALADDYDLDVAEVKAALAYEWSDAA